MALIPSSLRFVAISCAALSLMAGFAPILADTPPSAAPAATTDPVLEAKFESRTEAILNELALTDKAAAKRVHDAIVAHYKSINLWHAANDSALRAVGKPTADTPAQADLESRQAKLAQIHDQFVGALAKDLTPEQVEVVKDKLTYGKVQFTFRSYVEGLPGLTAENKAQILALLKEAREKAIDGGNEAQKSAVFTAYKGKINNYLSKQGVSQKPKKAAAGPS